MNIDEGTQLRKELDSLRGSVMHVASLHDVRQKDYSVLVVVGEPDANVTIQKHLKVLQFGDKAFGVQSKYDDLGLNGGLIKIAHGNQAARFTVGMRARALGLEHLVNQELLAHVPVGGQYKVIKRPSSARDYVGSLVHETEGAPLAAVITNPFGSQWWMLAAETTSQHLWLRAALAHWRVEYPDEHPSSGHGLAERWQSAAELEAAEAIASFEVETVRQLKEREHAKLALVEKAVKATQETERKERKLLSAQGDELVVAVTVALEGLGFTVSDSDATAEANNTAKREDLQITLKSKPGWIALAEVKGYSKGGAKSGDLRQLAKAVGFFTSKAGQGPAAQWYIVNAQFAKPPDDRPIPLAANAEDVEDFANDDGAIIDTRQIFLLHKSVVRGSVTQAQAQESLLGARGIYTAPVTD